MTEQQFQNLKIGDIITNKQDEQFRVTQDYVWGPSKQVYRADNVDINRPRGVQISKSNYRYWELKY